MITNTEPRAGDASRMPTNPDLLRIVDVIQFFRFVGRHKFRIAIALVVAFAVGWLCYANLPTVYESHAKLLVVKKEPLSLDSSGRRSAADQGEPSTHLTVIKSPWFVRRVIRQYELDRLDSLAGSTDPVRAIINSLDVVHENNNESIVSDSAIFRFAVRSPQPDDCPIVLNAFLASYEAFLHESDRSENDDAISLMTQKADEIQTELRQKEVAYQQFREAMPFPSNGDRATSVSVDHLADIESKRVELKVRRAEIDSRVAALHKALREDLSAGAALLPASYGTAMEPRELKMEEKLQEKLLPLLAEEKILSRDFGSGYPRLQTLREEIQLTRQMFAQASANAGRLIGPPPNVRDLLNKYVRSLEQELKDIAAAEQTLANQFHTERDLTRELALYELKSKRYTNDIARVERLHDTLITKLRSVDLSNDYGGYVTTVISPPNAGLQIRPNGLFIFALSIVGGIIVGFALAGWAEVSGRTFGSSDAVRGLGLPILGQVPIVSPSRSGRKRADNGNVAMDPILCTYERPDSAQAEAYRALRTSLCFSNQREGNKVVQITSPATGDGKSTLAANLAVSIAQSGKRVLLVDADLRHPCLHEIFRLAGDHGLATVLGGEVEPGQVIQPTGITGLSLLPSGTPPSNPADLLTSPWLTQLLSQAREQFDYVLVDSPAVLSTSDARIIAAHVDGVVLAIRPSQYDQTCAKRAQEILHMLDANLIGVIVNGAMSASHRGDNQSWIEAGSNGDAGSNGRRERNLAGTTAPVAGS